MAEPPFDIFALLKARTADIHQRVEKRLPIFKTDFTISDYANLVERLYGFWNPVETRLLRLKGLEDPELDLTGRLKSSLLEADLRTLGREPACVLRCETIPDLDSFNRGIGCLYVLEGSTLGGRIISRHVEKELHLGRRSGAAFHGAYGELVGERWGQFKQFAGARVQIPDTEEILVAATETFQCLLNWL